MASYKDKTDTIIKRGDKLEIRLGDLYFELDTRFKSGYCTSRTGHSGASQYTLINACEELGIEMTEARIGNRPYSDPEMEFSYKVVGEMNPNLIYVNAKFKPE